MRHGSIISLMPVDSGDLGDVDAVFDELTGYAMRVDGVSRVPDAATLFATALPPNHGADDKHTFRARHDGVTIGLLDIIANYPLHGVAFIGLLAIRESAHGKGFGRALALAAEQMAREKLKARTLRLAVVDSNPVMGFWTKMGFAPTGEVKPYQGKAKTSFAVLMEKAL